MEFTWWIYSLSGLIVGLVVGVTGVGGGSLMTPILIYLGIPPFKAVGTDLLYAAITKAGGVFVHAKKRNIDWRIVGLLSLGSLPASGLTLLVTLHLGLSSENSGPLIKLILGGSLILTAISLLLKPFLASKRAQNPTPQPASPPRWTPSVTVLTGVVIGVLVTLSSVGAGAIGSAVLFFLYPQLKATRIVGIDLAHAVPLTLVAGFSHLILGTVNLELLVSLLAGSLPGIALGSWLSPKTPDKWLKPLMALLLAGVGISLV